MSRAKTRRPGTRAGTHSGRRAETPDPFERAGIRRPPASEDFPDDLPSAAMAALDDLLGGGGPADDAAATAPRPAVEAAPVARSAPPPPPGRRQVRARTAPPRAPSVAPADDAQVVEETELPAVPTLRFAIYEDAGHLSAAQAAIVAAGHAVVVTGTGPSGSARVLEAMRAGQVDAVLVALAGSGSAGATIIDAALALEPRRPIVIAAVGSDPLQAVRRASLAGADLATTRPHDASRLAPILLAASRLCGERQAAVSARGSEQVLRAKLEEIADPEPRGLQPLSMFQRTIELEIKRARRFEYALSVALFAVEIDPPPPPPGIRGILRARAGNALIHAIRDIDMATQLDHERFLVLLPYTDLAGATQVGRRIIAAVGEGDPVVSAGRSFPPRLVGAVAGGVASAQLSFSKLMKDATRALDQARRDGAELAVQP